MLVWTNILALYIALATSQHSFCFRSLILGSSKNSCTPWAPTSDYQINISPYFMAHRFGPTKANTILTDLSVPTSVGSAKEAQHLKWAYYQLLLHLPECPLLLALGLVRSDRSVDGVQIQWGNSAALPLRCWSG